MSESRFEENKGNGNIFEIEGMLNTLSVYLGHFELNEFKEKGSAIHIINASLKMIESRFLDNQSLKDKGSSIYAESIVIILFHN